MRAELLQLGDAAIADLAAWRVHHARERHRVARVDAEAQVGEHILHLAPVVEAQAADQLIRDAAPEEHLLEGPGLRVGAIEHSAFGERDSLATDEILDLRADRDRLLAFVVDRDEPDRFADALLGPELFLRALAVVADHRVRDVENRLRRAVILFQGNGFRIREVTLEGENVAHVCASKAVDTLVIIADHRDVAMFRPEDLHQLVLRLVGVLVLVDEEVQETVLVVLTDRVGLAKQGDRAQQQVIEIQRGRGVELAFVRPVDACDLLIHGVRADPRLEVTRVEELVLRGADGVRGTARGQAFLVDPLSADGVTDRRKTVGLVVDRVPGRNPDRLAVAAQQPRPQCVKGAEPHPFDAVADQLLNAGTHLPCSLVGEGDGADLVGAHPPGRR